MKNEETVKTRRCLFLITMGLCLFAAIGGGGGCGTDKGACVAGHGCANYSEDQCDLLNGSFHEDKKCSDLGYS